MVISAILTHVVISLGITSRAQQASLSAQLLDYTNSDQPQSLKSKLLYPTAATFAAE